MDHHDLPCLGVVVGSQSNCVVIKCNLIRNGRDNSRRTHSHVGVKGVIDNN